MPLPMPMTMLMAVTINLFSFQVLKRKGAGSPANKGDTTHQSGSPQMRCASDFTLTSLRHIRFMRRMVVATRCSIIVRDAGQA